VREQNLRDLR